MRLYNSLSGTIASFERPSGRPLRLFVCGPTVYDDAHIGHARTYLAFDAFVRFLRSRGWEVSYLQNVTDVDDKIIARARERGVDPSAYATEFAERYYEDMRALGITAVDRYAPASASIPEIVRQVSTLVEKGFAYTIAGDGIYYDITKFPEYGKLSKRTSACAEDSFSRIDESVRKRNRGDFCLWKFPHSAAPSNAGSEPFARTLTVEGEPIWNTTLGWGRPGWHIEDTAISEQYFGTQYDIHGGAVDLKFPHHEAEIAQQEAASGKVPFVRVWMHTGFLVIDNEKMAKSKGNFITIRQFLAAHSPSTLRFLVLQHHYRSPMHYTAALAAQADASLRTLTDITWKLDAVVARGTGTASLPAPLPTDAFTAALEDDFNTPAALATLFSFESALQTVVFSLARNAARDAADGFRNALGTLGIEVPPVSVSPEAAALATERELCRSSKQFTQADDLRKQLYGLGYEVDDTPLGPFVRPVPPPQP
jgi:cysteinyl-tRNA synthetase